jgi:hypothetical protein
MQKRRENVNSRFLFVIFIGCSIALPNGQASTNYLTTSNVNVCSPVITNFAGGISLTFTTL